MPLTIELTEDEIGLIRYELQGSMDIFRVELNRNRDYYSLEDWKKYSALAGTAESILNKLGAAPGNLDPRSRYLWSGDEEKPK